MRMRWSRMLAFAVVGAVVLTATAVPASAAPRPAVVGSSMAYAGYIADTTATASASVNVVVPTITCTGSTVPLTIEILFNGLLTADGSAVGTGIFLAMSCSGNTASYTATLIVDEVNRSQLTVNAGHSLNVTLSVAPGAESLNITDTTNGKQRTNTSGGGMSASKLQLTTQGGVGSGGFAPFTPIVYRKIVLNGAPLSAASPEGFKQIDSAHLVMIKTSKLQGATGNKFTNKFVRNT
jgi:hypothetical protein